MPGVSEKLAMLYMSIYRATDNENRKWSGKKSDENENHRESTKYKSSVFLQVNMSRQGVRSRRILH